VGGEKSELRPNSSWGIKPRHTGERRGRTGRQTLKGRKRRGRSRDGRGWDEEKTRSESSGQGEWCQKVDEAEAVYK
jgi:hypothetical protein